MKKRIISLLLVIALLSGTALAAKVDSYTDVSKDAWYYTWVDRVLTKGYFKGYSDTVFAPEDTMNRAMMVTVLYRLSGDKNTAKTTFTDVPADTWYTDAVAWAEAKGVVNGIGNGLFDPLSPVLREQMAAIIARYLAYMEKNYSVSYQHLKVGKVTEFADAAKISAWAKDAAADCQAYGIFEGFPGANGQANSLQPQGKSTRAQAAKVLVMLADILENGRAQSVVTPSTPSTPSTPTEKTYTVSYQAYDGTAWSLFADRTYTEAQYDAGITVEDFGASQPADYTKDSVVYTFKGWATAPNNGTGNGQLAAGDAVTGFDSNNAETLYAVYAATDDYIYLAMEAAVGAMQDLADSLNAKNADVTLGDSSYNASLGDFDAAVTVGNLSYSAASNHFVDVAVTGALGADLVDRMLEIATTYALAILGPDALPDKAEIAQLVQDVAADLNIPVTQASATAIGEAVYGKLSGAGADVWSNFRNFDSKFCISAIDMEGGKLVLAVNDSQGIVGFGSKKESLKQAKTLIASVARELYASLLASGGSSEVDGMNVAALTSTITVEYTPAAGVPVYPAAYDINLTATLSSDMIAYTWDAAEGRGTVTLTINETLQEQYAVSLEQVLQASMQNGTAQEKLSGLIESVIAGSELVTDLKEIAGESVVDAAIQTWISDNLAITGNAKAYSPYEFFWTNEGVLVENAGVYSTGDAKVVGINDALYDLLDDQYSATVDTLINGLDSSAIKGSSLMTSIESILGTSYDLDGKVDTAFTQWKLDNTGNATGSAGVYTPSEFLSAGGTVVKTGDTYSLSTGGVLGVNDALHALITDIFEDIAAEIGPQAVTEAKALVGDYGWNNVMTADDRKAAVKTGVLTALDDPKFDTLSDELKAYLTNLTVVAAVASSTELGNADAERAAAEMQKVHAYDLMDQMLMKTVYNKVAGNASYQQFYGKTVDELKTDIDQTVMKTLASAQVGGRSLAEYMALAVKFKTLDSMKTVSLSAVGGMLRNGTFQAEAAARGNAYVNYLAKAVAKLPAGAAVTLNGVALNQAALDNVRTAAANDDTAGVCTALADLLQGTALAGLSMNSFADGETIAVSYNGREFVFILEVKIP